MLKSTLKERTAVRMYPYGQSAYRVSSSSADLSLKRYRFTGKERDEETGLDYFGVRYYVSWLGRWTSGDPGGFVDGLNLYRYARNNPVNGVDREGYSTEPVKDEQTLTKPEDTEKQSNPENGGIVNAYEDYSKYEGLEEELDMNIQKYKKDIKNAKDKTERQFLRKKLKAAKDERRRNIPNIVGYNKYIQVEKLIQDFAESNPNEYERLNNLRVRGDKITVRIKISDQLEGESGQEGETIAQYEGRIIGVVEGEYILPTPTAIKYNTITIVLYQKGKNLTTLANEFGDAIFIVEQPGTSYYETKEKIPYLEKDATKFSTHYEQYILKKREKPSSRDYATKGRKLTTQEKEKLKK